MSKGKRMTSTKVTQIVDKKTGELHAVETEKNFTVKVETERFYMCFFEKMGSFYGIKHLSDMKLIVCMCELAEFNTGVVHMTKKTREHIVFKTGISLSNISRNLKRLLATNLITEEKGDYTINPEVFWKGETKIRREVLNLDGIKFNITMVEGKGLDNV